MDKFDHDVQMTKFEKQKEIKRLEDNLTAFANQAQKRLESQISFSASTKKDRIDFMKENRKVLLSSRHSNHDIENNGIAPATAVVDEEKTPRGGGASERGTSKGSARGGAGSSKVAKKPVEVSALNKKI